MTTMGMPGPGEFPAPASSFPHRDSRRLYSSLPHATRIGLKRLNATLRAATHRRRCSAPRPRAMRPAPTRRFPTPSVRFNETRIAPAQSTAPESTPLTATLFHASRRRQIGSLRFYAVLLDAPQSSLFPAKHRNERHPISTPTSPLDSTKHYSSPGTAIGSALLYTLKITSTPTTHGTPTLGIETHVLSSPTPYRYSALLVANQRRRPDSVLPFTPERLAPRRRPRIAPLPRSIPPVPTPRRLIVFVRSIAARSIAALLKSTDLTATIAKHLVAHRLVAPRIFATVSTLPYSPRFHPSPSNADFSSPSGSALRCSTRITAIDSTLPGSSCSYPAQPFSSRRRSHEERPFCSDA